MKTKLFTITLIFAISIFVVNAQQTEENQSTEFDFSGRIIGEGIEQSQRIVDYPSGNRDAGDILLNLDVQTPTAQFMTMGSGFDGTYIWLTSGGVVGSLEPNTLIKMTLDGEVVTTYPQNTTDMRGMRDMTFDGEYLYSGDENNLYQIDPATGDVTILVSGTPAGLNTIRGLTYDATTNSFWGGDSNTGNLVNFIVVGGSYAVISTYTPPILSGSAGLAYDNNNGDPCIWVLRHYMSGGFQFFLEVVQLNIATQQTGTVYPVDVVFGGVMPGGLAYDFGTIFPGKISLNGTGMGYYDRFFVLEIGSTAPDEAPGYPSNLGVTPALDGTLFIDAIWVNPVLTVAGELLDELNSVDLYIDDDPVPLYTNSSPLIGGLENPTDIDLSLYDPGMHTIYVTGTNSIGEGVPTRKDVWLGEDVPDIPGDVILEDLGTGNIQLSWNVPTQGLHRGYFTGTGITYDIIRIPGDILVSEDQTETVFQEIISVIGNYRYKVIAKNAIGEGGTGNSNCMAIRAENYLMWEDFSAGKCNWTFYGPSEDNWWLASTDYAAGSSPELIFRWQPQFNGISRATSQQIDASGAELLTLEFNHYIKQDNPGYTVSVVTSSDGSTWEEVWSMEGANYGPATEYVIIDNDDVGTATFQLGFKFSGPSDHIDYWCIDNIRLVGSSSCLPPNELVSDPWDTYANLNWNENGTATSWEIEWGLSGFVQGTGTIITDISDTTFTLNPPFVPETTYDWYVRANCGSGDFSPWTGPSQIETLPSPITVFPIIEDFETFTVNSNATGYKNGWRTRPSDVVSVFHWNVWEGQTETFFSGPAVDHTTGTDTGKYLYDESSYGLEGDIAYVYSPIYDFNGQTNLQFSFWYHMYGEDMGELHVDINTGSGWISDIVPPLIGEQQTAQDDPWLEAVTSLNTYLGEIVKFRFRGIKNDRWMGDAAIDDVFIGFPVSVNPLFISNSIDIYPNPSSGIFTVSVDKQYTLNVIDKVGNIVYTTTLADRQQRIDLSGFPSGLYFFRFTSSKELSCHKVIIIN